MNVDRRILSHALCVYGCHPVDAVARNRMARSLAVRMVHDDVLACCEQSNAEGLCEAVESMADQISRIANYIAEGRQGDLTAQAKEARQ